MEKFILGYKLGMTRIFDPENGNSVSVTLLSVDPCTITFIRTKERDGYDALQLGSGYKKVMHKSQKGHLGDLNQFAILREFRTITPQDKKVGDNLEVSLFEKGEIVRVSSVAKAKGFQGVVKRHGFHGGPASHGQKHSLREPGSIGSTGPQKVFKGVRMAGRMGGKRKTVSGLKVVEIDTEHNILALRGAVPGRKGILVEIRN